LWVIALTVRVAPLRRRARMLSSENEATVVFRSSIGVMDYLARFETDGKLRKWSQGILFTNRTSIQSISLSMGQKHFQKDGGNEDVIFVLFIYGLCDYACAKSEEYLKDGF